MEERGQAGEGYALSLHQRFEIAETASYILRRGFLRVALQFPDELLKDSVLVTNALQEAIVKQAALSATHLCTLFQREVDDASSAAEEVSPISVQLFVMADTTYGSCCADEVAAAHVNAQCIIHYGHACLSKSSRLPVYYVFGRAHLEAEHYGLKLMELSHSSHQPLLVLYGLEYAHAVPAVKANIRDEKISFAEVACKEMDPATLSSAYENNVVAPTSVESASKSDCGTCTDNPCSPNKTSSQGGCETVLSCGNNCCSQPNGQIFEGSRQIESTSSEFKIQVHLMGGLKWKTSSNLKMKDYLIVWIGQETPAVTNFMLVYNDCTVVRCDPTKNLQVNVANQSPALKRRYYYVERAKDANVVGIVVGTLGVAGYREVIQEIRNMVKQAGKKSYTLLVGKPNPSKLANFPECDVFVLVACPETALLDSKEYLAPVITPFEAKMAFVRGQQWMGAYDMDFEKLFLVGSHEQGHQVPNTEDEEPRFSFLRGTYAETTTSRNDPISCTSSREIMPSQVGAIIKKNAGGLHSTEIARDHKSSAEYLVQRSFQGLELSDYKEEKPQVDVELQKSSDYQALMGRKGRAFRYDDEEISS